ncbi:transcriptional regulator [Robbsia sp. Bb-Pol-6]|uniref:Transcriptional regulator n=1 Tax=Robbsia betulipollinis TaxID=2981849 RepID=A0ABT3ZST0_9BURK|nr:transcriptional regulator [Robbsia betulipollinis]MCY0389601.1 transcriptional regulator [Robbsia betulipollinis]
MTPKKLSKFRQRGYRNGYVKASVEQGMAFQLRALRSARGLTQKEVATGAGLGSQSAVARLEDPSYGRMSIPTLLKLGAYYDVALSVQFVAYSEFFRNKQNMSEEAMQVRSFEEEDSQNTLKKNVHSIAHFSVNSSLRTNTFNYTPQVIDLQETQASVWVVAGTKASQSSISNSKNLKDVENATEN